MHIQRNIAFRFGTPEQRVKADSFDLCNNSPQLIGHHSNVSWTIAKLYFIIRIHISTNAEKLVKIGAEISEILAEIFRFFSHHEKIAMTTKLIDGFSRVSGPKFTKIVHNVEGHSGSATNPLIYSAIFQSMLECQLLNYGM